MSLAVLTDDRPDWRPEQFAYGDWGYTTGIRFGVVKLLDYRARASVVENDPNPFAAIVLAHLRALETRGDPRARWQSKTALVKGLYDRGLNAADVRELFRIIDWMMELPEELEESFRTEIYRYEEEQHMPYVTSIERLALKEGHRKGYEEGLKHAIAESLQSKFGTSGKRLLSKVRALDDGCDQT